MKEINLSDIPFEVPANAHTVRMPVCEDVKFIPPCEMGEIAKGPPEIKIKTYRINRRK